MATVWNRGSRGWFVRWTDADGKRRAMKVESDQLAGDVADRLNRAETRDAMLSRGPSHPLPIDDLLRSWRDRYAALRSERTQITDYGHVERLASYFGSTDLRDLRDGMIHAFIADVLGKGKSGHTAAGALSILRRVANLAAKDGLFEGNRTLEWGAAIRSARLRTLTEDASRDAWSPEETSKILALAADHEPRLYPALVAAFHTGMRRGELLALRWEDVDLESGRIRVRRAAAAKGGTKVPKAGRGRLVPLSATLGALLHWHRDEQRRGRLKRRAAPEWVFASPRGKFWQERNFSRCWERLQERFAHAKIRKLPLHCTRHTFITRALEAHVPVTVVSGWAGASPSVIERHYAHVIPTAWSMAFLDGSTGGTNGNQSTANMVTRKGFEPLTPSFGESRRSARKS